MAFNSSVLVITLDGTGTEIPTLNITDPYDIYEIGGSAIATGNYALVATGTPQVGTTFVFEYYGTLDITTNSKTFSIFGVSLTQNQLNNKLEIACRYDGSAWKVKIVGSLDQDIIESSNLAPDAVDTNAIEDGSITESKLANLSVSTGKVQNSAITTAKINNLAVTDGKINDVNGSKIVNASIATAKYQDDSVTNDKLATMTNSSIKFGNSTGTPGDLALGADEIAMGNGSTITAVNKSTFHAGEYFFLSVLMSFENDEQGQTFTHQIPFNFIIDAYTAIIAKDIENSNNGTITIAIDSGTIGSGLFTATAGTSAGDTTYVPVSTSNTGTTNQEIQISSNKVTAGGKVNIIITGRRT